MTRQYQVCSNCIMDTTDPTIEFDAAGLCNYCDNFQNNIMPEWNNGEGHTEPLKRLAETIKQKGSRSDFDCIIGLSGGLDSSYTAYVATEIMGLKPLLYHVDAGWNTEQAVGNIERLIDGLGLDLYTDVINWEEMRDLQRSYLKSGIADQDKPQDMAFFSSLYKFAKKNRIKYVLTGANYSTECCREPEAWGAYAGIDKLLATDIHRRFGERDLKEFPLIDIFVYKVYYQYLSGMRVVKPLNLVPFKKIEAENLLTEKYGWQKFQHKHHESRFTRFFEDYWLPKRFGFEKRRAHFSSLIMTGQLDRQEALERMKEPELSSDFWIHEFEYIANKLNFSVSELQSIFHEPIRHYSDYRNKLQFIKLGAVILQKIGLEKRVFR